MASASTNRKSRSSHGTIDRNARRSIEPSGSMFQGNNEVFLQHMDHQLLAIGFFAFQGSYLDLAYR
jgi:hypothetical protein